MQITQFMTMGPSSIVERFTLTFGDFTASGAAVLASLKSLPKGTIIKGVRTKHAVAFAGGGNSTATIEVGSVAGGSNIFSPAFDIFQAVADTTAQMVSGWKAGTYAADTLTATLRADVDASTFTAGKVYLDVEYLFMEDLTATGIPAGTGGGYL